MTTLTTATEARRIAQAAVTDFNVQSAAHLHHALYTCMVQVQDAAERGMHKIAFDIYPIFSQSVEGGFLTFSTENRLSFIRRFIKIMEERGFDIYEPIGIGKPVIEVSW